MYLLFRANDTIIINNEKELKMKKYTKLMLPIFVVALLAVGFASATYAGGCGYHGMHSMDLVHTAYKSNLKTLVAAIDAAELTDTLMNGGPFTIFAPTNEAFAALPEGTLDELLKPENKEQLVAILTYHVIPGKVMAVDVVNVNSATTVNGQDVTITTGDGVKVDEAKIIRTDILAKNGVIHTIDSVIMPN
jgi:uncharacterized surface protein with fasciclin (FAS1) repeats